MFFMYRLHLLKVIGLFEDHRAAYGRKATHSEAEKRKRKTIRAITQPVHKANATICNVKKER